MRKRSASILALTWIASLVITYKLTMSSGSASGLDPRSASERPAVAAETPPTPEERKLFDQIPHLGGGKDSIEAINAAFKFYRDRGATVNIEAKMLRNPNSGVEVRGVVAKSELKSGDDVAVLPLRCCRSVALCDRPFCQAQMLFAVCSAAACCSVSIMQEAARSGRCSARANGQPMPSWCLAPSCPARADSPSCAECRPFSSSGL
jgi:hypothetical protein